VVPDSRSRAAAAIYGLDRFQERQWKRLEAALGGGSESRQEASKDEASSGDTKRGTSPRRRVIPSRWMG